MRRRRLLACAAAGAATSGCAVLGPPPQTAALIAAPPAGLPPRVDLDAVPFLPQTPFHCGPAALASVLVHQGYAVTPESLADQVFLPSREGSLQVEMLSATRRAGAVPVRLPGELSALLREAADAMPAVVLLNLGLSFVPAWHYAVLVGFDLPAREVLLRSGTTRRMKMPMTTFEHTWHRAGSWAVAAVRPGRLPLTAREADAADAAAGFERAQARPAVRGQVHDSVLQRWPDNLVSLIGRGTARAAQGDWPGAAADFERAAQRHDSAAAWHNLALAQWQLARTDDARRSARRALERAEAADPQWREATRKLVEQLK